LPPKQSPFYIHVCFCGGQILHIRENMPYLSFYVWLISLNTMNPSSIHFPTNDIISFFFMEEYYSIVYIYHFLKKSIYQFLGT
jgi:hypothetical protein